ncbi:MAG: S9 family peptidase [Sphingomonadales bacterium]|nr:S9 family peptidase [Sphingomonadales bacterium]
MRLRARGLALAGLVAALGVAPLVPALARDTTTAATSAIADDTSQPEARPPLIDTSALASRNAFGGSLLSPDGRHFAMQVLRDGKALVAIFDATTKANISTISLGEKGDRTVEWMRWAGPDKLLIAISMPAEWKGEPIRATRLFAKDLTTNQTYYVGRKVPVVEGDDVIYVAPDGSYLLMAIQKDIYSYPSVIRFELAPDGQETEVQFPREGVWDWYADNVGVVRVGTGWRGKRLRIFYRKDAASKLELVDKLKEGDEESRYWDVQQILAGSDLGYVLDEDDDGRVGLRLFNYATREVVETVYQNPDWDVETVSLDPQGAPRAAYYTDDKERVVWFDEDLKRWQAGLEKAMPGQDIEIVSIAADKSRMLVWTGSPSDPGALYIFTPAERNLDLFAEYRPGLFPAELAVPKPVVYTARDGTRIHAYLTLPRGREPKDLPLIILPHGGPYGVRDKLAYDDEVQLLANRGYAVLQPNYRGSDGYGSDFEELGTGQIGRKMQDDLDDGMDWAVAQGIADKSRVCLVGSSYGGYAALWGVIRNPERYRCAASFAGVTDWASQLRFDRQYFSRDGSRKWRARIVGDEDGFALDSVSPYRLGDTLTRPVLLAHGKKDTNVPFSQYRKMEDAAKSTGKLQLLVFDEEGHGFDKPEDEQLWFDTLAAFLARHNPAD